MSMNNKQRWMGGVVLLGGGVLLAALLLKGQDEINQDRQQNPAQAAEVENKETGNHSLGSLTVDVETEKRLLEQQRRDREKSVAEQEARAAEFLAMQQQAEADAARKAAEEYAALNAHRLGQQSSDNIPPELVEDEQAKQKRLAEEKAVQEKKLAQQQLDQQKANSSTDAAKKEAERKVAEEKRKLEQQQKAEAERKVAEAKRKTEEERKAAEKKEAERKADEKRKAEEAKKKAAAEEAKKKAEAEQARKLLEGEEDKQWMVQVALAANEANADAVAAKLRAKGYKVTKSSTSKGVRIMVGPSKDRETADALRKKIASDASLNMKSAWVNDWVPLDKR